jgi:hypothetical protein
MSSSSSGVLLFPLVITTNHGFAGVGVRQHFGKGKGHSAHILRVELFLLASVKLSS